MCSLSCSRPILLSASLARRLSTIVYHGYNNLLSVNHGSFSILPFGKCFSSINHGGLHRIHGCSDRCYVRYFSNSNHGDCSSSMKPPCSRSVHSSRSIERCLIFTKPCNLTRQECPLLYAGSVSGCQGHATCGQQNHATYYKQHDNATCGQHRKVCHSTSTSKPHLHYQNKTTAMENIENIHQEISGKRLLLQNQTCRYNFCSSVQETNKQQKRQSIQHQFGTSFSGGRLSRVAATNIATGSLCYQARNTHTMQSLQQEKAKHSPPDDIGVKVPPEEVTRFMKDCILATGVTDTNASQLAEVLQAADYRGHFSHGLNRLEMYVNDVRTGICAGAETPVILKESVATALVDGKNTFGPVVGNYCMDLAIKKAKATGIGWVCARGSNHYGIAGWYTIRATQQGMLGMSFTNTSPLVAPTRAKAAALGTNPLSVAAPSANREDPFVLDMATCTVAVGKLEICRRKEQPLPHGWAIDKDGAVTDDPNKAINGGALMPLGGSETNSGYKGFGLAMMVEMFCGILSGGQYGPNVRRWMDTTKVADLGQCFVAIDPSFFAPGFETRMGDLMDHCRSMDPAEPEKPVLVAGDPERSHMNKVDTEGCITYHLNQMKDSWRLAKVLGVTPMKTL